MCLGFCREGEVGVDISIIAGWAGGGCWRRRRVSQWSMGGGKLPECMGKRSGDAAE